jgi:hypothetical protein
MKDLFEGIMTFKFVESHKAPVSLRTRPRAQDSRSRAETPDSAVELDDSIARLVGP